MRTIRVVIADDDAAFRSALVDVLEADPRFRVVAAVATGTRIGDLLVEHQVHLVVLDVRMPDGGALAARALRTAAEAASIRPPVVVGLSAGHAPQMVEAMLREGARGYFVKGRIGSSLPDQLVRCVAGELVLAVPGGPHGQGGQAGSGGAATGRRPGAGNG